MTSIPYRVKTRKCVNQDVFKYYFNGDKIPSIWNRLEKNYGPIVHHQAFKVIEIRSSAMNFKALEDGNPITVTLRRTCVEEDIKALHQLLEFEEEWEVGSPCDTCPNTVGAE